jgi:hypothetical protein
VSYSCRYCFGSVFALYIISNFYYARSRSRRCEISNEKHHAVDDSLGEVSRILEVLPVTLWKIFLFPHTTSLFYILLALYIVLVNTFVTLVDSVVN